MSLLVKKETCVCCRRDFNVLLEIKENRKSLDVECPYCKKVGETIGTKVLKVTCSN
jgi:hypothetical protein